MKYGVSEEMVEQAGVETLKELGWLFLAGPSIAPDGPSPQRPSFADVVLVKRLEMALAKLNLMRLQRQPGR